MMVGNVLCYYSVVRQLNAENQLWHLVVEH